MHHPDRRPDFDTNRPIESSSSRPAPSHDRDACSSRSDNGGDAHHPPRDHGSPVESAWPDAPPRHAISRPLPRWHVLLRNHDWYELSDVVDAIVDLTPLGESIAIQRMFEAHYTGSAFLLTTHRERAELYQQQFATRDLIVRIEPAE